MPQVNGASQNKGPVVVHSQDGVNETKPGNVQKKTSAQNVTNAGAPHRATPKEKSQKHLEKSMETGSWLADLTRALGDAENQQAVKIRKKANNPAPTQADMEELIAESKMGSVLSEAVNSSIKSIGEAITTAARKD
jgi:hypothetical protein